MSFLASFRALPTDDNTIIKRKIENTIKAKRILIILAPILFVLFFVALFIVTRAILSSLDGAIADTVLVFAIILSIFLFLIPVHICVNWIFGLIQIKFDLTILDARMTKIEKETNTL